MVIIINIVNINDHLSLALQSFSVVHWLLIDICSVDSTEDQLLVVLLAGLQGIIGAVACFVWFCNTPGIYDIYIVFYTGLVLAVLSLQYKGLVQH